jgi:hypothetical protein
MKTFIKISAPAFLIIAWMLFVPCEILAQRTCGTMSNLAQQILKDPTLPARLEQMELELQRRIKLQEQQPQRASVVYTIPVVFHVLYNNSTSDPTNLSDAQILSQIDVLNEDFRAMNDDIGDVPGDFEDLIADCEIEFCLAAVNPSGGPTSGITRKLTSVTTFNSETDDCKFNSSGGTNIWDRDDYLNIWVVPGLVNNDGDVVLGYAQFPGMGASTDGVVCLYYTVGRPPHNDFDTDFNLGRTATHEVGHWLNLRHIWGDDCDGFDQCDGSDNVSDTPNQQCANGDCPSFPLTDDCTTDDPGVLFMDYMDYVDDVCMLMFTNGQRTRMRNTLEGTRESILTSTKCCPANWILIDITYPGGTDAYYRASNVVFGSGISLITGNNFVFQGANVVTLGEGFIANSGSFFIATNETCDDLAVDTKLIGN